MAEASTSNQSQVCGRDLFLPETSSDALAARPVAGELHPLWLEWRRTDTITEGRTAFLIQSLILQSYSIFINLSCLPQVDVLVVLDQEIKHLENFIYRLDIRLLLYSLPSPLDIT